MSTPQNISADRPIDRRPQSIFFWLAIAFLAVSYLFFKFFASHIVTYLFQHNTFSILNILAQAKGNGNLEFYQGKILENVIGPVTQILSASLLMMVGLRFFKNSDAKIFAVVIFAFLIITKFEVLAFPPYGETNAGPLAEAVWLYQNHFDYAGLAHQNNVDNGGPKVYLFSIYPGFVALLLKLAPMGKSFLVFYHLLMFAAAAMVVSLLRSVARKVFAEPVALLLSLALLSLPLFQSMTEVVNMEMLCLFFATLSVYFLVNKKIGPAALASVLAVAVKGPGGIASATVFVTACLLFLSESHLKRPWRILLWATGALVFGFLNLYLLRNFVSPVQAPSGTIKFLVGWDPVRGCAFLLLFLAVSLSGLIYIWVKDVFSKNTENFFFIKHYPVCVSLIFVLIWFAMYLNLSVMGPRYKLLLAPFLLLSVFYAVFSVIRSERWRQVALVLTIVAGSLGSYGLFHPEKVKSYTYGYNELERSLEYQNDLKLDMALVKTLETEYPSETIGAPWVIAQILRLPELGYVTKPLDVVIYGFNVNYGGIKNFEGLKKMDLRQTIWVGFERDAGSRETEFPIDPQFDYIVKRINFGDKEVVLFRGGLAIEKMRLIYEIYHNKDHQMHLNDIRHFLGD